MYNLHRIISLSSWSIFITCKNAVYIVDCVVLKCELELEGVMGRWLARAVSCLDHRRQSEFHGAR